MSEALDNNWIDLFLTGVLAFNFIAGLKTGSTTLFFAQYKKSDNHGRFWAGITLSGVGTLILLTKIAYSILHI